MRASLHFIVSLVAAFVAITLVSAQECHDYDADGSQAGYDCAVAGDCQDHAWNQKPFADEMCNGIDDDCDGDLDLGCDRNCESPSLFQLPNALEHETYPELSYGCAAKTDYGYLVVTSTLVGASGDADTMLLYARPYDSLGRPLAESQAIGDPSNPEPKELRCEIAYAGDRLFVVWQDGSGGSQQNQYRLKARLVDRFGAPIGDSVIDLSSTSPFLGQAPWNDIALVWTGEEYAVFWRTAGSSSTNGSALLVTRLTHDGVLKAAQSQVVTDDVDGLSSFLDQMDAIWTGDHYIVVVTVAVAGNNLHVLRIDDQGLVLGNDTIPGNATHLRMSAGQSRILVGWTDDFYTQLRQRAAFVNYDGTYQSNPGLLILGLFPNNGWSLPIEMNWSGEIFGIVSGVSDWTGSNYRYLWKFYRVKEDGTVLDPGGVDLSTNENYAWEAIWNGKNFALFGEKQLWNPGMHKVICSCDDLDGDFFDACTEFDCDDSDPLVFPTALESCRGLKDENCDGLVDCDDPQCPAGAGPGEITDLGWDASGNLAWSNPGGAERYDLARGVLSDLKRREDLMNAECAGLELDNTTWVDDGRNPPLGEVLWYVVRPEGTPCSYGTWGPGANAREITVCR
ncbi:MAG: putative metal-binding motif-containing protein [Acidobacteria bacterium]|uniref:Putative metal-binding motif-containing protein n=1 Tax=Candidatus Polarisedimenticola svalbardensis TaxID=2886004 RepID=A0A8J6Y3X6_9BACT|nr:putative metal-binding motif-containing protein [Candidatus Polarisedimenticola svalbardensis]